MKLLHLLKKQACLNDRATALSQKKKGEYTYGPGQRPEPCGNTRYLCDGKEYLSLEAYRATTCGAPPQQDPPPVGPPPHCANFKPHAYCAGRPSIANHPLCKCT